MHPRGKLILGLAVAISIGGLFLLGRSREPRYDGKSLTAWLEIDQERNSVDASSNQAGEAVRKIGTNALPTLLAWVREDGMTWEGRLEQIRTKLPTVLRPSGLGTITGGGRQFLRARLYLRAFRLLKERAYPAIPALKRLMKETNEFVWQKANLVLATIGGEGLRALAEGLPDQGAPQARLKVQNIAFRVARFKGSYIFPAEDGWQRNFITNIVRELTGSDSTNAAPK